MKTISIAVAGLALATMMTAAPTNEARADGGIVIGIGAYLLADALVGSHCNRESWPFNIVTKLGDEIHGRDGCYRGYYDEYENKQRRHRRHHQDKYK
jgi:hypothetical protein